MLKYRFKLFIKHYISVNWDNVLNEITFENWNNIFNNIQRCKIFHYTLFRNFKKSDKIEIYRLAIASHRPIFATTSAILIDMFLLNNLDLFGQMGNCLLDHCTKSQKTSLVLNMTNLSTCILRIIFILRYEKCLLWKRS